MGELPAGMTSKEEDLMMDRGKKVGTSATETLIQPLANQRRERETEEEARLRNLEEQLALSQQQLREQREAAEGLILEMLMERDESCSQLGASEAKAQRLEQQLKMALERLS